MMFELSISDNSTAVTATAISSLEGEIFSDPWSEKDIKNFMSSELYGVLTCKAENRLFGYAVFSCVAGEAELLRIAVAPQMRRQGIAVGLMHEMIKRLKEQGAETLFLEVRKSNSPAISLYGSVGFSQVSVRRNYYRNPTEDAVIMSFNLVS